MGKQCVYEGSIPSLVFKTFMGVTTDLVKFLKERRIMRAHTNLLAYLTSGDLKGWAKCWVHKEISNHRLTRLEERIVKSFTYIRPLPNPILTAEEMIASPTFEQSLSSTFESDLLTGRTVLNVEAEAENLTAESVAWIETMVREGRLWNDGVNIRAPYYETGIKAI